MGKTFLRGAQAREVAEVTYQVPVGPREAQGLSGVSAVL